MAGLSILSEFLPTISCISISKHKTSSGKNGQSSSGSQSNSQALLTLESSSLYGQHTQVAGPGKILTQAICDGSGLLKNDDVREMLSGMQSIRERQDNTDNCLIAMQSENAVLWKEISMLRQKHAKQQQIVEKLIHFLMSIVSNPHHDRQGSMKRKAQLMIDSSDRTFFVNGNKRVASGSGPVIHDVTNDEIDAELDAGANCSPIVSHQVDPIVDGSPIIDEISQSGISNILDTDLILDPLVGITDIPTVVPTASATQVSSTTSFEKPSASSTNTVQSIPIPMPSIPVINSHSSQATPSTVTAGIGADMPQNFK